MPAQKRSRESTPPPPPPEEEKNDDSKQHEENETNTTTTTTTTNNNNDEEGQVDNREDSDESPPSSPGDQDEFVTVKLSEIRKEVQCPICLGIIRKTRTVMECLHRFCRECIDKAMRLGNNECPACRTHCASRRSLRDDPNYDALIAALYPDIEKYEEEELAFHDEEKARNKQIQASIAQTFRRQTEALGRKRTSARNTAAAFMRSQGNYRNLRGRRSNRAAERRESDDEQDANCHDGSKDSSSADERSNEVKSKRHKRWAVARSYPSAAGTDVGSGENDSELNREPLSAGLVGSSEVFSWGKGGIRSHNRHGGPGGSNKLSRNSRLSKLIDCLRCSNENNEVVDISLMLVSLHENGIPSLQRPYLCCRPTLSVRHLCEYVAMQTSMQAHEIEMLVIKNPPMMPISSGSISESKSFTIDPSKNQLHTLQEHQLLEEIQQLCSFNQHNLVLAYRQKL